MSIKRFISAAMALVVMGATDLYSQKAVAPVTRNELIRNMTQHTLPIKTRDRVRNLEQRLAGGHE